jgi:hypothetical protein
LAAACLALAPLPMVYKYQQEVGMVTQEKQQWDARTGQLKGTSNDIQQASAKAQDIRGKISQYENLMNSRFNWIIFFSQLQTALVDTKDVWLDGLEPIREAAKPVRPVPGMAADAQPAAPATLSYKLDIKGRMLLRDFDPDAPPASRDIQQEKDRIHAFIKTVNTIPFVKSADDNSLTLDQSDPRMLGFEFTVIIDPQHPL